MALCANFMRKFTFSDIVFSLLNKYNALPTGWEATPEATAAREIIARQQRQQQEMDHKQQQEQRQQQEQEQKRQEQEVRRKQHMQVLL